ncbi:unnamed protein product [Staurois parvus]|uniref:Uncharacterized protein n=1 Tax=Staurois parvus TaxID=386267 RepID=A0ABN9DPN0_9NEOB|nr:unnamed protein product [Staurois parvus]
MVISDRLLLPRHVQKCQLGSTGMVLLHPTFIAQTLYFKQEK